MSFAIFALSDGTTRLSLLPPAPIRLIDWQPARPGFEEVRRASPFNFGSSVAAWKQANVIETLTYGLKATSGDLLIHAAQELDRLLLKAVNYWSSPFGSEPVWIEAQGSNETNVRYATVKAFVPASDTCPFTSPFFSAIEAGMAELTLVVEHEVWRDTPPTVDVCLPLANGQEYFDLPQTPDDYVPAGGDDDAYVDEGLLTIDTGGNALVWGANPIGAAIVTGIRFVACAIPAGAHITAAHITGIAENNLADDYVYADIRIEDDVTPAGFTTAQDFMERFDREGKNISWGCKPYVVHWGPIPAFVAGNSYDTPDISVLIQAIVDDLGWVIGNDIVIYLDGINSTALTSRDWKSFNEGHPPELHVEWTTNLIDFGRTKTCAEEVFVANKHNRAQLTHAFWWSAASGFSGNLIGAATPFDLFDPLGIADDDCLYLGIDSTVLDSGPFGSAVFDISTAVVYVWLATLTWWYSQGGGVWGQLIAYNPHDHESPVEHPFRNAGVQGHFWFQPDDWVTDTVNGVTAWWVMLKAFIGPAGSITVPTQANRDLYSVIWPYVEVEADDVGGDLPAFVRLLAHGQTYHTYDADMRYVLCGLRSLDRGEDFTAYINLADEQNNPEIEIDISSLFASYSDFLPAPTGRAVYFTPGSAGDVVGVTIRFSRAITQQFRGRYKAMLRYYIIGGLPMAMSVTLSLISDTGTVRWQSSPAFLDGPDNWGIASFGQIDFPFGGLASQDAQGASILLTVTASDTPELYLTDLILMPCDEGLWCFDGMPEAKGGSISGSPLTYEHYLDMDSVTRPKHILTGDLRRDSYYHAPDIVADTYAVAAPGPLIAQPNKAQRWWFLQGRYNFSAYLRAYDPVHALALRGQRALRYMSMRGAR